jgi:CheY-like chemotaxis protein
MRVVLVADDDLNCRDSMRKVFEREGYTVEAVTDVDGALEALKSVQRFDLVVCDYRMPGKTGIDLLKELRRRESYVPVMMVSALADAATEATVKDLGAVELLKEPLRRTDLIDRAARIVGG